MFVKTLKTVVLKTVTVTSWKLGTPADRIGLGRVGDQSNTCSMDNLSRGAFPMPPYPESESARTRRLSLLKRQHADGFAVPPASSVGCSGVPGGLADGFGLAASSRSWRTPTQPAAKRFAESSQAMLSGDCSWDDRLGSDCQSPDRSASFIRPHDTVDLARAAAK
jgi:hypothetical protein